LPRPTTGPIMPGMLAEPVVHYILAGSEPIASTLDFHLDHGAPSAAGSPPVWVCRQPAPGMRPHAMAAMPGMVMESWLVDVPWLAQALEAGLDLALAERIVVRVGWPLTAEAEAVLLSARLSVPPMRLAVQLGAPDAAAAFLYFNRLGFSWLALPATIGSDWIDALRTLSRLWCLDPRARISVEPIQSAFARAVRPETACLDWAYRVIDLTTGAISPLAAWSPSVHSCLVGAGRAAMAMPLEKLPAIDAVWTSALPRVERAPRLSPVAAGGSS
jgi:hypothetical protein